MPEYDSTTYSHETHIYTRPFIGVHPQCLKELQDNNVIKSILEDLLSIEKNYNFFFSVAFFSFVSVLALSFSTIKVIYYKIFYGGEENQRRLCREVYTEYIFGIFLFITTFLLWYNLKAYSTNHNFLSSPDCVDEYTLSTAKKFYPNLHSVYRWSQIGIFLSLIMIANFLYEILKTKLII